MNTAEILSLVSVICYILAGVFLLLAVFFWVFFKIPGVIGDLSGRTARKSIAQRRQANERSGNKSHRPSAVNAARGKITDTMEHTAKRKRVTPQAPPQAAVPTGRPETGILTDNKAQAMAVEETAALDNGATELLVDITAPQGATPAPVQRGKKLTMINEVMLIHTDEVISNL